MLYQVTLKSHSTEEFKYVTVASSPAEAIEQVIHLAYVRTSIDYTVVSCFEFIEDAVHVSQNGCINAYGNLFRN